MLKEVPSILSVSALNQYIKSIFDEDIHLRSVCVRGEISSFRRPSSGHLYFSIKDANAKVKAVMFARDAYHLSFDPKEGDEVLVIGRVSVYMENGEYQLYVEEMEPYGKGKYFIELEKLKKKLEAEGLFAMERKKPIPAYPKKIGVITAKNSAAFADIKKNIYHRFPLVEIYVFYATVQGEKAPESLIKAFNKAITYPLDTLIIGRGGGANEDLSAFNDEKLVRALADSPIPIISAVGHEIDTTLCDLVSSARVSTPTAAAVLATPDKNQIYLHLDEYENKLLTLIQQKYALMKEKVRFYKSQPVFMSPTASIQEQRKELSRKKKELLQCLMSSFEEKSHHFNLLKKQFYPSFESIYVRKVHDVQDRKQKWKTLPIQYLKEKRQLLTLYQNRLALLNPNSVLERGYAYLEDEKGHIVSSNTQIEEGQTIQTTLKDGIITSNIIKKENNHGRE